MRSASVTMFLLLITLFAHCQQKPARLIIRGDDMGYSHAGNEAIIKTYKEGIEKSIEVIVPSPWFPEAVQMLKDNPNVDVGIHLAITSEWDNVKWRPLSDCPSLKDENGYFFPMVWPNKNYPQRSIQENKWKLKDIEKEFRAQIETGLRNIPRVSHLSSHMGCTELSDSVRMLTKKLAKEYKIDIDLAEYNVSYVGYDGAHKTLNEKKASFIKALDKLEAGKIYLFVDHPGLDSPELKAIHHIGYEDVSADRQGVTLLWTNDEVKDAIKKRGIELISYKDLRSIK
jgi:chitin disaccharide deacetylase